MQIGAPARHLTGVYRARISYPRPAHSNARKYVMPHRAFHAPPRAAITGTVIAGFVGVTGAAAVAQGLSLGLFVLGASAAGIGVGVARLTGPLRRNARARYERRHRRLAGPRPGARLG
jgi:hypothetical protein